MEAQEGISGSTETFTWELSNGTLIISGNGAVVNYDCTKSWWAYKDDIATVLIENGVINIEEWIFAGCENLISISIPESVANIGAISLPLAGTDKFHWYPQAQNLHKNLANTIQHAQQLQAMNPDA